MKAHVICAVLGLALIFVPACSSSDTREDSLQSQRSAILSGPYVGLFQSGNWALDSNKNRTLDGSDRTGNFGVSGDLPFVVHRHPSFNPNGNIVGIFRDGTWCFDWDDSLSWGSPDTCNTTFGQAGDKPVVGRWFPQCTSSDCIGVFRDGNWTLDTGDKAYDASIDVSVSYGTATSLPVVGSWRTTEYTNIGYFDNGNWVLDTNGNMVEEPGDLHGAFGIAGDLPIAGDWDGDGIDNVGIFRPSTNTFCLDMNGDATWNWGVDICFSYGAGTDNLPVVRGTASAPGVTIGGGAQIIACKYSDDTRGDDDQLQLLRNEFTSAGQGMEGAYDYIKTVSYGKVDWDMNQVFGWYTINKTLAEAAGQPRSTRAAWCRDAAIAENLDFYSTPHHFFALTDDQDSGAWGGTDMLVNWINWAQDKSITYITHEALHTYGFNHSRHSDGSAYGDGIDIMSCCGLGGWYQTAKFGGAGPSLNAAYRYAMFGTLLAEEGRIWSQSFTGNGQDTLDIVAVDHPEVAGVLMVRLPTDGGFYSIEFREKSGWDRAMGSPSIPELSSLVGIRLWEDAANSTKLVANLHEHPGPVLSWSQSTPPFSVTLNSVDTAKHVANITMTY